MPSTKGERISDTVKFQHHAIAMPELTPADRILEATKQLKDAISQQPKRAPMKEMEAIEMLRQVMMGERKEKLPKNSVQESRSAQIIEHERGRQSATTATPLVEHPERTATTARPERTISPVSVADVPTHTVDKDDADEFNYISDDEDDAQPQQIIRRSKRVLRQLRDTKKDGPNYIAALVENETAEVPDLVVKTNKLANGMASANQYLQMNEWAYDASEFAGAVIDEETGKRMEYRDLIKKPELLSLWTRSLANELGRLTQGIRDIVGTNTMFFIPKSEIPHNRRKDITYGRIVVGYKPDKLEKARSRLTVGGDRLTAWMETATPTADLPLIKMLWNSVLSTPAAKYFTMDISNFYLATPMDHPEYMRLPMKIMPQEIIDKYNLNNIASDGWVYVRIERGMYGLPVAGRIANDLLVKRMRAYGYHPCQFTPGLWRHVWRPIAFTLVVDDFGIKFVGDEHAHHLKRSLERHYDITVDWDGSKYVGISLKWDYEARTLETSVPGFVKKSLGKFQHPVPTKPQHAPAKAAPVEYGLKVQKKTPEDTSPELSPEGIKKIQDIVGTFAWYSRATDPTMAQTLSSIASRQSKATTQLKNEVNQFLDYCATHPDAIVRYKASDMILALHSDASHLSEPLSKSRAAGHFYLTNKDDRDVNNGAILTLSKIIKHVMGSAGESEVAALYYNCKSAIPLRTALEEMGHEQPRTPAVTDNSTAAGLINKTMTPKRAKAYDQRFNWLKCREAQKMFHLIWKSGKLNRADFHTKKHPIHVYQGKRGDYVAAPAA